MADHHQALNDWLERSARTIQDWEDWRDAQDPRTLGLPPRPGLADVRTSEASTEDG